MNYGHLCKKARISSGSGSPNVVTLVKWSRTMLATVVRRVAANSGSVSPASIVKGSVTVTSGLRIGQCSPTSSTACGKESGQTAHVERWNNTLRQRIGRFVRKTLSFSKCVKMHEYALLLFLHRYNLQFLI